MTSKPNRNPLSHPQPVPFSQNLVGKCFIHPAIDYGLIAGGWSIAATGFLLFNPSLLSRLTPNNLPLLILLVNSCHFAASTVRLYTKPEFGKQWPFLTVGLPLATFAVLFLCVVLPETLGPHLQALYLTWSPFHYAAQTYGLAVMYSFRSGFRLDLAGKNLLWWACMLPFFRAFLGGPDSGLGWIISRDTLSSFPIILSSLGILTDGLLILIFLVPLLLMIHLYRKHRKVPPLIILVFMFSNGLWWTTLDYVNAFVLATIAHGLQYLGIVLVYHVKDQMQSVGNRHSALFHSVKFYGQCLLLAYGLFYCWPYAFVWAGAGLAESMLLVIATINIHHFIVDRYIWRQSPPPAQLPAH